MKKILGVLTSIILILGALMGLAFAGFGIWQTFSLQGSISSLIQDSLQLADETIETTSSGLLLIYDSLDTAETNLSTINSILSDLDSTMTETTGTMDSVGTLIGEDMSDLVGEVQDSLAAAQTSAALIDNTLRILSLIPFSSTEYDPENTLAENIAEISTSMDSLPESFTDIQDDIDETAYQLGNMQISIQTMEEDMTSLTEKLADGKLVIEDYQDITGKLSENIEKLQQSIPGWVNMLIWGARICLIWIAIISLAMILLAIRNVADPV